MKNFKKTQAVIGLSILCVCAGFSLAARAGGFQLYEENVTNLGNAFAGTGAEADDASTEFFNPAGMTRLNNPQVVIAGTLIDLNVDAHVDSAVSSVNGSFLGLPFSETAPVNGEGFDFNPGKSAIIPAFHFVYPICNQWALGFGATAPFGLETEYPDDSIVRNLATTSKLQTVDVGPSIAYQITKQLSLGFGIDSQYLDVTFDQAVANPFAPGFSLGDFLNDGSSWGWGWHAGALYQFTPATRVGFTYHSRVNQQVQGRALADLVVFGEQLDLGGNFSAKVTLPDYANLSIYHDFNPQWAVLGGIDYTHWSLINVITAHYSETVGNAIPQAVLPFDFRNTYRVSAGVNYKPFEKWTFRTGVAFDESPVQDSETRTFRLPDSNRYWIAFGAQYIINREFTIDAGYSHLFVQNSTINNTQTVNAGITLPFIDSAIAFNQFNTGVGNFKANVNEVGVQLTWNII